MTNRVPLGRDFDRDKNLTYRPQDESGNLPTEPIVEVNLLPNQSIVEILLKQHRDFVQLVKIVKNQHSTSYNKHQAFHQLLKLWKIHAIAEENTLYEEKIFSSELKHQVDHAMNDHEFVKKVEEQLEALNFRSNWNQRIEDKAKALASYIENHLIKKEETVLKKMEILMSDEDLLRLGREFTRQYEAAVSHVKASLIPAEIIK